MPLKGAGWTSPCNRCVGRGWGDRLAVPEGTGSTGVALCGEALGDHEDREQLPFRPSAPAGSLLERAIRMAGFSRSQFTVYNTINCRPPNNKLDGERYEESAVESCQAYNDKLVASRKPRVIVALGGVATRALTDFDGSTRQRTVGAVRGYLVSSRRYARDGRATAGLLGDPLWVLPTYHPSHIQRGAKELLPVLIHDLRLAVHVARVGARAPRTTSYQLTPGLDDALSFLERVKAAPGALLSYDIETPWSKENDEDENPEDTTDAAITTIQFSLASGEGISLPWTGRYIDVARDILIRSNPKIGCNSWQFDEPRIHAALGKRIEGTHHDLRWAFHCLYPDLPTSLQFISSFLSTRMMVLTKDGYDAEAAAEGPWKHTASTIGSDYGCRDVDMPQRVWPLLEGELHRVGAWRSYQDHTLRLRPPLVRASGYGIPINRERHAAFESKLTTELAGKLAELQPLVPDDLKRLEPKEGYKNPKLADKRMALPGEGLEPGEHWVKRWFKVAPKKAPQQSFGSVHPMFNPSRPPDIEPAAEYTLLEGGREVVYTGAQILEQWRKNTLPAPDDGVEEERWGRQQDFLPDSPQQVIALIRRLGDKVPRADDDSGDTTGKAGLERLARQTKRPVYRLILEARALAEMRGTHVEGWRPITYENTMQGATPQSNCKRHLYTTEGAQGATPDTVVDEEIMVRSTTGMGRVHGKFTPSPATGQLACYGHPNLLNPPKPKAKDAEGNWKPKDRLAVAFRAMIQARPGYRLWELDLKSAHALTLGYEAGCPEYMRLARIDIHSYVAAHMVGGHDQGLKRDAEQCLSWPDDQLSDFLITVKKAHKGVRDDKAKPAILGIGFGMGVRKLYQSNRESFDSEADARRLKELLKALFPRIFRWQDEVRKVAHLQGRLVSRHGAIRWFQDVYHVDAKDPEPDYRKKRLVAGQDSEAAIAFLPANDAFGYLKDAMLRLDGDDGWLDDVGLMIPLHDALVFEMPIALENTAIPRIYAAMTAPSPVLDGLSIGVSVSCGPDWSVMSDVDVNSLRSEVTV